MLAAEAALRCVPVVSRTEHAHPIGGRGAAARPGVDVIELEEPALAAPYAVIADKRAALAIPLVDRAPHLRRHMPRELRRRVDGLVRRT